MMSNRITDLRPGDIGFGPIDGAVGLMVALGQLMLGDESRFRHVFVVTQPQYGEQPPTAVEAMPAGAREVSIGDRWTKRYLYVRLPEMEQSTSGEVDIHYDGAVLQLDGTVTIGDVVARHARALVGTPYSFADYLALALKHWGVNTPMLRRYIASSGRMICSQLADQSLSRGLRLLDRRVFDDNRLSQDVTPGALYYRLLQLGGQCIWPDAHR